MDHLLEINEFFVEGKDHKKSHVLLHIAEPVSRRERERGYFFVVAEINDGYEEQIEYLQQIIDDIEHDYYDESNDDSQTFEQILQAINRRGHNVLKYKDAFVSCVIGTLNNGIISLAYHGEPHAILYYPSKGNLASTQIITEPSDSEHLFSELIEGNINPGDFVFVCTPRLMEYFSRDRLRKLLGSRSTAESAKHVQKVLHDLDDELSFGGLIVHVTDKHDRPRTGKMPKRNDSGSAESLNKLIESKKQTEDTLSPPLFSHLLGGLKNKLSKKEPETLNKINEKKRKHKKYRVETNHRKSKEEEDGSFFEKLLIALGHGLVFLGTALLLITKKVINAIQYIFVTLFNLITNKNNGRTKTVESWQKGVKNKQNFFKHLPLTSKIILSLTIILGVSFLGSIGYLRIKEQKEATQIAYNNIVQSIVDKKDAAEAALVYNEKEKAFVLLQEAEQLLSELPQDDKKQIAEADELKASLEVFLQELRNLHVVTPDVVATLMNPDQGVLSRMERTEQGVVVFGSQVDTLYDIQLASGNVQERPLDAIKNLSLSAGNTEANTVYFLTKDHNLAEFDNATKGIIPREINFPATNASIGATTLYNGKLYTVDTTNAQIYKHNKTQTGFDKGSQWITGNSLDLTKVQSMVVDGNVFLGHSSGEITKLFRGEKQSFIISGLDPQLESVTAIYADSDTGTLYILDGASKRVVLLDKEGTFKKQFSAAEWQSPMSMFIDEANNTAYVLDSNIVYKFGM